jgi:hypothetical protein
MSLSPDDFKAVAEVSQQVSSWALGSLAATVLAVLSASYRRPVELKWRLPYLLFVPAWALLAASLHFGNRVTGAYVAANLVRPERLSAIAEHANHLYLWQHRTFLIALMLLALWLLMYLAAWIFVDEPIKRKEPG